ncbi:MAG: hypothetical protein KC912_07045 [Proteobacteria bacterium]|nr:hypothetical protein [Pseudomonadota bacterium]
MLVDPLEPVEPLAMMRTLEPAPPRWTGSGETTVPRDVLPQWMADTPTMVLDRVHTQSLPPTALPPTVDLVATAWVGALGALLGAASVLAVLVGALAVA